MGDPKKPKKKYSTPSHPWQKARIDEEKTLIKEYGLKNKREIWKIKSILKNFTKHAKRLIALKTKQAELEKKQLLNKLISFGFIQSGSDISEVLNIKLKDVMEKRLQTIIFKKGLAKSIKQARQFIVHGHIMVGSKVITVPSYLTNKAEEEKISFKVTSSMANSMHPERVPVEKKIRTAA